MKNKKENEKLDLDLKISQQNSRISKLMDQLGEIQKTQESILTALEEVLYSMQNVQEESPITTISNADKNMQLDNIVNQILLDNQGKRSIN